MKCIFIGSSSFSSCFKLRFVKPTLYISTSLLILMYQFLIHISTNNFKKSDFFKNKYVFIPNIPVNQSEISISHVINRSMAKAKLTQKQKLFSKEYMIDLNATQAAIRAGYSEKTAFSIGVENLKKPLIQNAISSAMEKRSKRTEITQDRVLEELARIAFGDLKDIASWGTSGFILKSSDDLSPEQSAAIAEISETATPAGGGNKRVKRYDKVKALELLMRHMGMLKDKIEHTGANGAPLMPVQLVVNFKEGKA